MKTNIYIIIIFLFSFVYLFPQSKYILNCRADVLYKSELILISEVGTIENSNSNSGYIEKYLNSVGLKKAEPYCAAGQYYCFAEAVRILHLQKSSIPIRKTGNANLIFIDAVKKGTKSKYIIKTHDLIIWRKGKTSRGHIERVVIPGKVGWATTVGFNVRIYDSFKKKYVEGVFFMKRNIYHPLNRMRFRGIVGFAINKEKK